MITIRYLLIVLLLTSCTACSYSQEEYIDDPNPSREKGGAIFSRFNQRDRGFYRVKRDDTSFATYLRNFSLKGYGEQVRLYNGELKQNQDAHAAVLDIDVGNYDLQQCADAVMRLRAEFLYLHKRYDDIHFNFTNGFPASYTKWRQGWRIKVNGNHCYWAKSTETDTSYKSFRSYLKMVFTYAGTLSLSKELKSVEYADMQIGDVFIQGGSPGHAVIVMDMIENEQGQKLYMLAQSYMPAQDIHILKNPHSDLSPWYLLDTAQSNVYTPEWTFSTKDLRGF